MKEMEEYLLHLIIKKKINEENLKKIISFFKPLKNMHYQIALGIYAEHTKKEFPRRPWEREDGCGNYLG